jgi:hypothetical protein
MAEKVVGGSLGTLKKAIQLALGPDLESIKKDLADLKSEVRVIGVKQGEMDKRFTSSIDSLRNELRSEIKAVDSKLEAKVDSVLSKVDQIDKKLDIDRRMTIMEAKMKEIERK